VHGNLLSRAACDDAVRDAAVIYHLAAGTTQKSFAEAYLNCVVGTRNLLDSTCRYGVVKRFVNVSSFAVYSNRNTARGVMDESSPVEREPAARCEAYVYAKMKQDQVVLEYAESHALPYVIVRPGIVYGPGNTSISGRVGSGALGIFLHLGGANTLPLTYVDNCAEAIVLAGLRRGIDGEVFNIVDDDLPTSRQFLRLYKRHVRPIRSVPVPRIASYALCAAWEGYSRWSEGQLPPLFNRSAWHAYWKGSRYTNAKARRLLGWRPRVSMDDGLRRYFEACREAYRRVA
jgi:nucleoside-diphosphate-sugar epimerase